MALPVKFVNSDEWPMKFWNQNRSAPPPDEDEPWGDFPPEPRNARSLIWIALAVLAIATLLVITQYIWRVADSGESTLDRINGLSTVSLALIGLGTAALAGASLITSRRAQIAQYRPIIFPYLSQSEHTVHLVLANGGNGNARDLTFRVAPRIRAAVGGPYVEDHFRWRLPISFLPKAGEIPIDIFGGDPQKILDRSGDQILTVYLRYQHGFTDDIYREKFELNLDQYGYGMIRSSDGTITILGNRLR
jgi:hypothetical protein